jgi:hypothetical protein
MQDFERFKPRLLRNLIASWKEETDQYLASLIPDKGKQKNLGKHKTNRLKLATTFFKCRQCTELISYPGILWHECLLFGGCESENEEYDKNVKEEVVVDARGPREPRPPKHITADMALPMLSTSHRLGLCAGMEGVTFDEAAFNAAWDITTACGEDPNTVTHDSMKQTQARLVCLRCRREQVEETGIGLVMKWTTAEC